MDKIAMYEEEIHKEASRAWKKHIGELSAANKNLLIQNKILDHKKELAGLNEGTKNIVKGLDGVVTNSKLRQMWRVGKGTNKEVQDAVKAYLDKDLAREGAELGLLDKLQFKAMSTGLGLKQGAKGALSALPTGASAHNTSKTIYTPKKGDKGVNRFADSVNNVVKGKNKNFSKEYTNAIVNRHEADELRELSKNKNIQEILKKKNTDDWSEVDLKRALGRYRETEGLVGKSNHASPKVIARESAHVAIAPQKTRDTMTAMRTSTREIDSDIGRKLLSAMGKDPNAKANMREYFTESARKSKKNGIRNTYDAMGLEYGKSGVYDKKLGKRMDKIVSDVQERRDIQKMKKAQK